MMTDADILALSRTHFKRSTMIMLPTDAELLAFARAVAAMERERCKEVCGSLFMRQQTIGRQLAVQSCAEAIEALKDTP